MKRRKTSGRALLPIILLSATTWTTVTTAKSRPIVDADDADTPFSPRHISHAGLPFGRAPVVFRADPDTCFQACQLAIAQPVFTDLPKSVPYRHEACYSKLVQTTIYLCLREYCSDGRGHDGLDQLNGTCIRSGQAALPSMKELLTDYPPEKVKQMRQLQRDECTSDTHLSAPVVLSQQLYENSYDTLVDVVYAREQNSYYSCVFKLISLFHLGVCLYTNVTDVPSFSSGPS